MHKLLSKRKQFYALDNLEDIKEITNFIYLLLKRPAYSFYSPHRMRTGINSTPEEYH